jgi:hypothetical protein
MRRAWRARRCGPTGGSRGRARRAGEPGREASQVGRCIFGADLAVGTDEGERTQRSFGAEAVDALGEPANDPPRVTHATALDQAPRHDRRGAGAHRRGRAEARPSGAEARDEQRRDAHERDQTDRDASARGAGDRSPSVGEAEQGIG